MARSRRSQAAAPSRGLARDRHGRGIRAAVTGPHLPLLRTRVDLFEMTVASTAEYLRDVWPDELADVRFEIAGLPAELGATPGLNRWRVFPSEHRMLIESCVFRAVAELLGKDPWDLAPDRFRHF
jgi:hypothetical protein